MAIDFTHPQYTVRTEVRYDHTAHAERIVEEQGGVDSIVTCAELAFSARATLAYTYWCDLAREVARITGQDDAAAAGRFCAIYDHLNLENWKARASR